MICTLGHRLSGLESYRPLRLCNKERASQTSYASPPLEPLHIHFSLSRRPAQPETRLCQKELSCQDTVHTRWHDTGIPHKPCETYPKHSLVYCQDPTDWACQCLSLAVADTKSQVLLPCVASPTMPCVQHVHLSLQVLLPRVCMEADRRPLPSLFSASRL